MSMTQTLASLHLPPLRSRTEMLDILQKECYGYRPTEVGWSVGEATKVVNGFDEGEAVFDTLPFTVKTKKGMHTFPLRRLLHHDGRKRPFIVFLQFSAESHTLRFAPDLIAEAGFDLMWFHYNEVTSDNGDFENGVAPLFPKGCGKIAMWSRVASLVLDYAETLPCLDMEHACVAGHSRLGKTALLTAALDERFKYVFSNNAGCAGDALHRGTTGETIAYITHTFPHWFCADFAKYAEKGYPAEWDQHFLLASVAPRFAYVGISDEDAWADPKNEQLCCLAAGVAWERGLVHNDRFLQTGECLHNGSVGCHLHKGPHKMSYRDWLSFLEFVKKHW